MSTNQLTDFFREKRAHARPTTVDWEQKRNDWVAAVEALYHRIDQDFLGDAGNLVSVEYEPRTVQEQYIGSYQVRDMVLKVGDEAVRFSPKGVNVVGTIGRIDVIGDYGEATIVRQPGDRWSVVVSRTPTLRLAELSPDTLAQLLKEVMRP